MKTILPIFSVFILLAGCSNEAEKYPSPEGKAYPYILKEGCQFSIVNEYSRATIASPEVEGLPGSSASAGISLGDLSVTVSNCKVVENLHGLSIYEE